MLKRLRSIGPELLYHGMQPLRDQTGLGVSVGVLQIASWVDRYRVICTGAFVHVHSVHLSLDGGVLNMRFN